jgi:hypothetical protein
MLYIRGQKSADTFKTEAGLVKAFYDVSFIIVENG